MVSKKSASPSRPEIFVVDSLSSAAQEVLDRHRDLLTTTVLPAAQALDQIERAHFLIARSTSLITAEVLKRAKHLKLIVFAGSGVDGIDLKACADHGVLVMDAGEANASAAADLSLSLLLSLLRQTPMADEAVRSGRWSSEGSLKTRHQLRGTEIRGKSVSVIGYGRVGRRVAARIQAFEPETLMVVDPYVSSKDIEIGVKASFEEALESSDILSFHIPLNDQTRGFFGLSQIEQAVKKPFVVNTSRGPIVDETAIAEALMAHRLRGYAADVFQTEPISPNHPLLKARATVFSPHIGAQTHEAQDAVNLTAVQKVIDFLLTQKTGGTLNTHETTRRRKKSSS